MQNIRLAILRTYLAVAKTGSFTLAAKINGITLSAVSYQMSGLEASLGKKLFVRNRRGVTLSESGFNFLSQARLLLKVHDQISNEKNETLPSLSDILMQMKRSKLENSANAHPPLTMMFSWTICRHRC